LRQSANPTRLSGGGAHTFADVTSLPDNPLINNGRRIENNPNPRRRI